MPGATVFKWRQNGGQPDSVAIDFSFCRKARVEITRHISAAEHAYGRRQQCIHCLEPARRCQEFPNVSVYALREGVNTCVRSSGSVNAHPAAGDALKRAFEMILDGVAMQLALPAGEWRTVIGDDHFQPS